MVRLIEAPCVTNAFTQEGIEGFSDLKIFDFLNNHELDFYVYSITV